MSKVYVFDRCGGPEGQEPVERPAAWAGPGGLGVKDHAAAVNPVDWQLRSGHFGQNQKLPVVMRREIAGIITAVGDGVEGYTVGDEILGSVAPGHGGFVGHTTEATAKITDVITYGLESGHATGKVIAEIVSA